MIDIRLFQTALLEITNFIWNEIKEPVTFERDWNRAEEVTLEHARGRSMPLGRGFEETP